jgi:hypothetical protein
MNHANCWKLKPIQGSRFPRKKRLFLDHLNETWRGLLVRISKPDPPTRSHLVPSMIDDDRVH